MNGLRPYQKEAVKFLLGNDRGMILASVGAGKTAITLTTMSERGGKYLIFAPKRVCEETWPVEAAKWAPSLSIAVATGTPKQRLTALAKKPDILVINYDAIPWLSEQEYKFNAVVFDELTKLKNHSGKRFKALAEYIKHVPVRWGLTGSFTSNGLEDTFGQCKIVNELILGKAKSKFLSEYFYLVNREYMEWAPKFGGLERVMAKVKPHAFVLESKEYKDTLPPMSVVEMNFTLTNKQPYNTMRDTMVLESARAIVSAPSAASVVLKLQQLSSGFLYDTTKTPDLTRPGKYITDTKIIPMGYAKFDALDDLLESNQRANTLIFYNFKEELAELKRRYPKATTLDDPGAVANWNEGKIELLLAHPKSAQFGLNLQYGGNKIVFLTLPWSLTDFEQAIGRLHRSGQMQEVLVYVMLARGTVDQRILAALKDKRSFSDVAINELL